MVFAKIKWGQVCTPSCTVVAPSRCPTTVGILGILWYSVNTEHVTMNKQTFLGEQKEPDILKEYVI